jgi:hypothetical protein
MLWFLSGLLLSFFLFAALDADFMTATLVLAFGASHVSSHVSFGETSKRSGQVGKLYAVVEVSREF